MIPQCLTLLLLCTIKTLIRTVTILQIKLVMETLLEQQRRYHEERERLMDALVQERLVENKTHKDGVNSEHRQKAMLERYDECTAALREIYEDKDGLRKEEITALSGPNEFAEFYSRLKGIKDFHRRHPGEVFVPMSVEFDELKKIRETTGDDSNNMVEFSDEEGYGKFLDLHECYDKFINLKGVDKMDYINYITSFDQLYDVPRDKKGGEYRIYLSRLYLGGNVLFCNILSSVCSIISMASSVARDLF